METNKVLKKIERYFNETIGYNIMQISIILSFLIK